MKKHDNRSNYSMKVRMASIRPSMAKMLMARAR